MNELVTPLFATAAGVLFVAGLTKLRSPVNTRAALQGLGLPDKTWLARAIGVAEAMIGAACLLAPGRLSAELLTMSYAIFTIVVAAQRRAGNAPCGCFGESGSGADVGHFLFNLFGLAIGATAAATAPQSLLSATSGVVPALVLTGAVACGVYLCHIVLTMLPAAWNAYGADSEASS